jgi:polyisoprenoid-binding protein YceI
MKLFSILSLAALLVLNSAFIGDTVVKVDASKSKVTWLGKKVTGQHTGMIKVKSGSLKMNKGALSGGSFEIDMNSIECTDLQGEYAGKLVGHLKSDDFFGSSKFPVAKFDITKVSRSSAANTYLVDGNMTIKGISQPVSFEAVVNGTSATAKIMIDRTQYGIRYGSGSFFDNLGDKAIDNEFTLDVQLALMR